MAGSDKFEIKPDKRHDKFSVIVGFDPVRFRRDVEQMIRSSLRFGIKPQQYSVELNTGPLIQRPTRRAAVFAGGPFDGQVMEFSQDSHSPLKDLLYRVERSDIPPWNSPYSGVTASDLSKVHVYRRIRHWPPRLLGRWSGGAWLEAALYQHEGYT